MRFRTIEEPWEKPDQRFVVQWDDEGGDVDDSEWVDAKRFGGAEEALAYMKLRTAGPRVLAMADVPESLEQPVADDIESARAPG
jgi:hypothetical protein